MLFPSSWHHKVASSAISESREEPFIIFFNTLSFCLGQGVLIYHFLVIHKPEKDPGCFRGGMHEALSHRESLCQMLILQQNHVLLGFWEDFFFSFFFFLLSSVIWGRTLPGRCWAPKNPVKPVGARASYGVLTSPGVLISVDLLILEEQLNHVRNHCGLSRK